MVKRFLTQHPYKLSIAWAILIFALCATPGRFIPSVSWLELLSFDKWVHAGVFFILVSLFAIAVQAHHQSRTAFLVYFILSVLYGGALEIMQAKVFSERSADWYDMIANTFGCLMALLFFGRIKKAVFK
jgi:VanZ family protein